MPKKVAVLVIHGIGSQESEHFADPMILAINKRLERQGLSPDDVAWQPIYWADITEGPQRDYFRRANEGNDLDYVRMRQFILSAFGDAASYQLTLRNGQSTYEKIHQRIATTVKGLYQGVLGEQSCPMIVMAHSLGGHVMSNYIWDQQKASSAGSPLNSFESMQHIAGMITFGCNIPLFTFSHDDVKPFTFPGSALSANDQQKAQWLNFFDPDDVLGYPLKPINAAYDAVVDADIAINVGGWAASWNPLSHLKYWTDRDFTRPAAEYIGRFLG